MYRKLLSSLRKSLWAICISALLIDAGLFFHWFYVLAAGVIVAITTLAYIIEELKHGDDTAFVAVGFVLTVVFAIAAFFYHGERYISQHGHKQHLYSDCPSIISSSSVKEVTELEGFFYLIFSDCKKCRERQEREIAAAIAAEKQQEREGLRGYLSNLIDSLDNGADPEDIEQLLQNDWGPDKDDEVTYPDQP